MVEISTSLLSVEKDKIIKTIYNLETAKIDYFHIDVMDGIFVENNTTEKMIEYCNYLNNITNIPLDIQLMVEDVKKYVDMFLPYNPNIITIHYESVIDKNELLIIINALIINDKTMRENNIQDIVKSLNITLNNNIFKRNLKDTKNNWLDISVDEVVNNVINYFTYLEKIIV